MLLAIKVFVRNSGNVFQNFLLPPGNKFLNVLVT
jgi:hypothetical protein